MSAPPRGPQRVKSHIEAELDDIPVLHHILFTLNAELAGLAGFGVRTEAGEIVVVHDLCRDKAPLEVTMDDAGRAGGFGAFGDGPGAGFFLSLR